MRLNTMAEAVLAAHGRHQLDDELVDWRETHGGASHVASPPAPTAAPPAPATPEWVRGHGLSDPPPPSFPPASLRIMAQVALPPAAPPEPPPTPAAASTTPTASPQQLAMVDLALADPLNQELIQHYAPNAVTAASDMARDQVALYGAERFSKMQQLAQATAAMRGEYIAALNQAQQQIPTDHDAPCPPGWHWDVDQPGRDADVRYTAVFDIDAFTNWYVKQDGLASRGMQALYGGTQTTQHGAGGEQLVTASLLGANQFQLINGYWSQIGEHGEKGGWIPTELAATGTGASVIDIQGHPDLYDPKLVWFDPTLGFVTAPQNIKQKQDFLDKALPSLVSIGLTAVTAGAGAFASVGSLAGASGSLGATMLSAAAASAFTTLNTSLLSSGSVHLKDILKSALTGAVTAGITNVAGLDKLGLQGNTVVSYADRAIAITGQATLQGALQQIAGGKFKDGFTAGLASGLAAEVTRGMQAGIQAKLDAHLISGAEASAYRLLTQATGSAIRMLSNPNDPGHAMAQDFLGTLVGDGAAAISQPAPMTLDQLHQSEHAQGNAQTAPAPVPEAAAPAPAAVPTPTATDNGTAAAPQASAPAPAPTPALEAAPAPTVEPPAPAPADDANASAAAPASQPAKVVGVNEDGQKIVATNTISWVGNIRPIDSTGVYLDRKQVPVEATDLQAFQDDSGRQFWGYKVNGEQQYAYMPPPGEGAQLPAPASPVPEPGTLALAGAGAGTIAVRPLVPTIVESVVTVGRTIVVGLVESELLAVGLAATAINMRFPSSAGQVEITEIDDNRRLVKPTDELYGIVQERNANGEWKTIGNMATLHSDGKLEMTVPTPKDDVQAIRGPRGVPADPPPRQPIPPYAPPDNEGNTRIEGKQADGQTGPTVEVLPAPPPVTIDDLTFDQKIEELKRKDIPSYKSGDFNAWFDQRTPEEIAALYKDPALRDKIETGLRGSGGKHEFLMVAEAPQWKQWGVSADEVQNDFAIPIADLNEGGLAKDWTHSTGRRGENAPNSKTAHNELQQIIKNSNSLEEYKSNMRGWADKWINGGYDALPPGFHK